VAYEIGRLLEAKGKQAALIALMDCSANDTRLSGRVKGHVSRLVLGPDRHGYLVGRARTLKRKAALLAFRLKLRLFYRAGETLPANLDAVSRSNYLAAYSYVPKPCNVGITLFRCAERGPGAHPDYLMGWRNLALGGIQVVETPGDHGSMMKEPHVRVLAEKLDACVRDTLGKFQADEDSDPNRTLSASIAN
jgi:thioesterase domain-containing protein